MRPPLTGSLHRRAVCAFAIALFVTAPLDVRAQLTNETRVNLDRVELTDSVALIYYTLGSDSFIAPVDVGRLLELALDAPSETNSLSKSDLSSGTMSYRDKSWISEHEYQVDIEEDGFVRLADLTDGSVASIPVDIVQWAGFAYENRAQGESSPVASVILDTQAGTVDYLLRNTVPLASMIIFVIIALFLATSWIVHKARRERQSMLASRRRLVMARDKERAKLAADLHDGPIQEVQLLLRSFNGRTVSKRSNGDATTSILHNLSDELRDICADLRPPVLHHFGFPRAARTCVNRFQEHFPLVEVNTSVEEFEDHTSDEQRMTLYRALQESLMNVGRHANAKNVWVTVHKTDNEIVLSVKDDGRGFNLPKSLSDFEAAGHLGLSFLSQRVDSIGARISITSSRGKGTQVRLVVPLRAKTQRHMATKSFATAT